MAAHDLVLVDTCIWIQFFNRPRSREKHVVNELLDEDRVALIGPILLEVLQGCPKKAQADWVASVLRGVHYLEVAWDYWRAAAHGVHAALGRRRPPNQALQQTGPA